MTRQWLVIAFVVLLQFTRPDGSPVWINPASVVKVAQAIGPAKMFTEIQTYSGSSYVTESVADVVRKLSAP